MAWYRVRARSHCSRAERITVFPAIIPQLNPFNLKHAQKHMPLPAGDLTLKGIWLLLQPGPGNPVIFYRVRIASCLDTLLNCGQKLCKLCLILRCVQELIAWCPLCKGRHKISSKALLGSNVQHPMLFEILAVIVEPLGQLRQPSSVSRVDVPVGCVRSATD